VRLIALFFHSTLVSSSSYGAEGRYDRLLFLPVLSRAVLCFLLQSLHLISSHLNLTFYFIMDYTLQCISYTLQQFSFVSSHLVLCFCVSFFLFVVSLTMMGYWLFSVGTWAGSLIYFGPSVGVRGWCYTVDLVMMMKMYIDNITQHTHNTYITYITLGATAQCRRTNEPFKFERMSLRA
jgi:hypothetical protein